ncbi:MAG TPA: hypothetical protein DET40_16795 [Lentisphaeria bacterium]|nr:MAG: hypothetical protein A2X45_04600 [Lentisphaerae bacterium GWF2_50_93]HCE45199.1 hypothetical protein [Lentisphaeria bacterium]
MVTQKDIARKLGISRSLVSRAIAGTSGDIGASEETVRRIHRMAEKCGYMPNAAAQSLRGVSSMTIGVVVKDFADPFFGKMIGEIQSLCKGRGFSMLLAGYSDGGDRQPDTRSLLRYSPDAILICGSHVNTSWLRPFIAKCIPAMQIGSGKDCRGLSRIEMDEEHAVLLLLQHLKSLGHREIAFIGNDTEPLLVRKKLVLALARKKGMKLKDSFAVTVPASDDAGISAIEKLLKVAGGKMPTAVIAADDMIAQGGLKALHEAGLSVPKDISLTGIDDIPSSKLMIPALTTISSPVSELVRAAFSFAVNRETAGEDIVVKIRPGLVVRESCSRAPGKTIRG